MLGGVGGWTPHDRRFTENDEMGWDVDGTWMGRGRGEPVNRLEPNPGLIDNTLKTRPLARKMFGA